MLGQAGVKSISVAPIERVDVSEAAYTRVRDMIVVGDLPPGIKIDLDLLAGSLQVGRTTVANALQRLHLEELVEIVPRRGTFVSRFTLKQVSDLYEMRLCLELYATQKAADGLSDGQLLRLHHLLDAFTPYFGARDLAGYAAFARCNRDFHTYLVSLADNDRMLAVYNRLHVDVLGYRVFHIRATAQLAGIRAPAPLRPPEEDHREHAEIVAAFEARDPTRAAVAIRDHLESALEHSVTVFSLLDGA